MYDGLLHEHLRPGVGFLAYADDVALVAKGKDIIVLERLLSYGAEVIVKWMANAGLELSIQKSEAMVITNARTHNVLNLSIKGTAVKCVTSLKYLGIYIDQKLNFKSHSIHVSEKASKVASNLTRILPNISEAKPQKRRLLAGVVHFILLHGAPIWAGRMSESGIKEMAKCQRRIALRVASAYSTVSADTVLVIADMPPIDILAVERLDSFNREQNRKL